ncbi:MAG: hypothetical protein HY277_04365, partial [Ignavibacteriales bacterium]|nr:hypothetical protein [Ignavibacteriales bacterium]
ITTEKEFINLVKKLRSSTLFVFDTETTGTDPLQAELIGLSFAVKPSEAWYVSVKPNKDDSQLRKESILPGGKSSDLFAEHHPKSDEVHASHDDGVSLPIILKHLSPIFEDPAIKKVGQNIKYDMLVLRSHGMNVQGVFFDTMVANYILRTDGQHNMDAMASEHLNYKTISYDDLTGTGRERKELREIELARIADYSAEDADITFRLYETLAKKLGDQRLLPQDFV